MSGGVLAASGLSTAVFLQMSQQPSYSKMSLRTGPLPSPSLTAKNALSWVTTYAAISLIWHSNPQNYSAEPGIDDKDFQGTTPAPCGPDGLGKAGWQGMIVITPPPVANPRHCSSDCPPAC